MSKKKIEPERPRSHIIADLSYNFIERRFLDRGHTADPPKNDYGYDMLVVTFQRGFAEPGEIRIQLKATDAPAFSKDRTYISFTIDRKHYSRWTKEVTPVVLVLYNAIQENAYWLDIQEYFKLPTTRKPRRGADSVTVRIPTTNRFTIRTVDTLQSKKNAMVKR